MLLSPISTSNPPLSLPGKILSTWCGQRMWHGIQNWTFWTDWVGRSLRRQSAGKNEDTERRKNHKARNWKMQVLVLYLETIMRLDSRYFHGLGMGSFFLSYLDTPPWYTDAATTKKQCKTLSITWCLTYYRFSIGTHPQPIKKDVAPWEGENVWGFREVECMREEWEWPWCWELVGAHAHPFSSPLDTLIDPTSEG